LTKLTIYQDNDSLKASLRGDDYLPEAAPRVGAIKDVFGMPLYVIIEYAGGRYMGSLLIDASFFCYQVYDLLQRHIGYEIHYIGGLDVGYIP
jgi:hypothetical protein